MNLAIIELSSLSFHFILSLLVLVHICALILLIKQNWEWKSKLFWLALILAMPVLGSIIFLISLPFIIGKATETVN